jgi:hypothetical protein
MLILAQLIIRGGKEQLMIFWYERGSGFKAAEL